MSHFIYLRGLRKVEHSVFSVADGQKSYRDPQFGRELAYSSGQQVKRSVLDLMTTLLNQPAAPITFNWIIENKKGKDVPTQGEAWSLCDPSFPDQLVGGYMKAEKDTSTIKRRSPLSISAMRPLHPLLGGTETGKGEAMSFDRGDAAQMHTVKVYRVDNDKRVEMSIEDVIEWSKQNDRNLAPKKWIEPQKRATGLFVYDIAIDMRTLFSVSLNPFEPEINTETIVKLRGLGWTESKNHFGKCLVCPIEKREVIIEALSTSLIEWMITSNQARTFSTMETVAIAISNNASQIAYAIRAELHSDGEFNSAKPIIDPSADAQIFTSPTISSIIVGESGSANAPVMAAKAIKERLLAYNYEG